MQIVGLLDLSYLEDVMTRTQAQAILDERYARGDISNDEYTVKRATIEELKK